MGSRRRMYFKMRYESNHCSTDDGNNVDDFYANSKNKIYISSISKRTNISNKA